MRRCFIFLIFIFSLFFFTCTFNGKLFKNTNPINAGFIFIDGKYIKAPYYVETKDFAIYINGLTVMSKRAIINPCFFDHDPGMPSGVTKYMTLDEAFGYREPSRNILILAAKQWYLFSHYSYYCAYDMTFDYIKSFPNVKSYTKKGLIESYAGEKFNIAIGGSLMRQLSAVWSFKGIGPPEDEIIKMVNKEVEKYKDNLKNGYVYFIFTKYYKSSYNREKGLKLLSGMINIMKQPLSEEEKINELVSIGLLSKSAEQRNRLFVSQYSISSQLEKKIRSIMKSLPQE